MKTRPCTNVIYRYKFEDVPRKNGFCIRKTCPYNVYPPEPHFYIVKMRFTVVYLFSLFFNKNIDCGPR